MPPLKTAALVSAQWLKKSLAAPPRNFKVLDCTWGFRKNGYDDYLVRHIPTAQFWDANKCVSPTRYIPRALPSVECFTKYAREIGINPDSHLVLYDQDLQLSAARTWWNFRAFGHQHVSVLNGGMGQWDEAGYKTQDVETKSETEGTFEACRDESLIVDYEKMQDIVRHQSSQILDARNIENFKGEADEPSGATVTALETAGFALPSVMAKGHLPGATNCQIACFIDKETRLFNSPEEIKQAFIEHGFDLDKPITSLCYNGLLAALYPIAAAHIGKHDVSMYYGSWTEFGQRAAEDNLIVKPKGSKVAG